MDGWRDYKSQGPNLPESWEELCDRLLEGADLVGQFLREATVPEKGRRIRRSNFNKVFAIWSQEEEAATCSSKGVNDSMKERGHVARKYAGEFVWPDLDWPPDALTLVAHATGAPAPGEAQATPDDPSPGTP